jgi:hypothetical protein
MSLEALWAITFGTGQDIGSGIVVFKTRAVPKQMYGISFGFPWETGVSSSHVPYIRVKTAIRTALHTIIRHIQ